MQKYKLQIKIKNGFISRFLYPASALCLFYVFAGCATDKVAMDLAEYMNRNILHIAELENKTMMRYTSVNCVNCDITDEEIYDTLKHEVVPNYRRFLNLLKEIRPETDEVRRLHAMFIHGAEMIYSGFRIKMIGLEKKDKTLISAADDKIDDGIMETYRWNKTLMALSKEHKVAYKKKK